MRPGAKNAQNCPNLPQNSRLKLSPPPQPKTPPLPHHPRPPPGESEPLFGEYPTPSHWPRPFMPRPHLKHPEFPAKTAPFCHTHMGHAHLSRGHAHPAWPRPLKPRPPHRILGLCNNLPYVVMLSAARDLLDPRPVSGHAHLSHGEEPRNRTRHDCNPVGTGVGGIKWVGLKWVRFKGVELKWEGLKEVRLKWVGLKWERFKGVGV
uniref:Uncharacterized protein n=1 Tax=Catharus ustulatus TaxID=91951 RepID=A0A8C3UZ64_CATUS